MFDVKKEVLIAEERIRPYVRETPLDYSVVLSKMTDCEVYLKCENFQRTGAFKVRGAMNKLLALSPTELANGVVAASSGNHGAAVAFGLTQVQSKGIIFVPRNTASGKIDTLRSYNVPLELYADDCGVTEAYANDYAKQNNMTYISPYNDPQVIGGQGTIAVELMRQLDKIDVVLAPVGGGGLIAGIAGYLKSYNPSIQIIGCLPENSPVMYESIKAGHIIQMETKPTLSDATAGGIEEGAITFDLCKCFVDDYITVTENEIKEAITFLIKNNRFLVEGAAGMVLAGFLKNSKRFHKKNVVIVLSSANISLDDLKLVLNCSTSAQ